MSADVRRKLVKAISHPLKTLSLVNRRYVHLFVQGRDPEAQRLAGWVEGRLPRQYLTEIFPGIENESIHIVNAYKRAVNMSQDLNELCALCAIERHLKAKNVLEIGTFDGNTAINLAANVAPGGRVVTVDLPPSFSEDFAIEFSSFDNNRSNPEQVGAQFKGTVDEPIIRQVFADSATLDYEQLAPPFDLFFIDGCHAAEYVAHDTAMARKYTRPGGVIVWHDYGMLPGVSGIVDKLSETMKIQAVRGCRLAVGFN